ISSFTKIEYIRMFDQLKMRIEQKVRDIEEAIKNGADYVAEMKSVLQEGIEELNTIVAERKSDIQAFIAQAKTDLTKVKDDATEDITTTANNAKTSVQDTASTAVNSIGNKATEATEHVDTKVSEFNQTVEDNGFLTPDKLTEDLTALDWQKHKLTKDDGYTLYDSNFKLDFNNVEQLTNLGVGTRYIAAPINTPIGASSNNGWLTKFDRGSIKYLEFRPYNSSQIYIKRFYNTWSEWEQVNTTQTDTGWIPYN